MTLTLLGASSTPRLRDCWELSCRATGRGSSPPGGSWLELSVGSGRAEKQVRQDGPEGSESRETRALWVRDHGEGLGVDAGVPGVGVWQ